MMDFSDLSLLLDIGFAGLLVIVLIYAVRLNRHIAKLQDSKAELEALLRGFVTATQSAESAVSRLKESSQNQSGALEQSLSQGKQLQSDLSFIVSRAEEIAGRLEKSIREGRTIVSTSSASASPSMGMEEMVQDHMPSESLVAEERNHMSDSSNPRGEKGKSKSDLLKALQGMR